MLAAEGDVRDQEQRAAEQVAVAGEEEHARRWRRRRCRRTAASSCFLRRGPVGDRADHRQHEHLQDHRQRDRVREEATPGATGCPAGRAPASQASSVPQPAAVLGDGGQVRAEEHGDDGGGEGRVGPVVEVPADPLAPGARSARRRASADGVGVTWPSADASRAVGGPATGGQTASGRVRQHVAEHLDAIGHDAIHTEIK